MTITKFTRPQSLEAHDTIGILSTARAIDTEELTTSKTFIESMGYNVIYGATIGARHNQYAGDDDLRRNDLQTMIDNPEIKAIICARGGYGTARILSEMDWSNFKQNPKWILGYSDVTAIHNTLSNMGIMSMHGIMPINVKDDISKKALSDALHIMAGKKSYSLSLPEHPLNHKLNCSGQITGGNLSMIYSLRGTPHDINPKGKILFLEDLDEYLYHIDRMILNLKLGNVLEEVAGIVIGGMSDMNDNTIPYGKTAEEIIAEHVQEHTPLFFGAPFGHFAHNLPVVCGAEINITDKDGHWQMEFTL
ncbi:MAG: LD-carboxypeptidase [Salinivirgaceae bacterium]|nr:MAG: LD-carboxypeptidase [Salinivirgaceae bacterium]